MWRFIARAQCLIGVIVLLSTVSAGLAQADPHQLTVSMMHGTYYPPHRWIPVRIDVRNNTDQEFTGHVSLPVRGSTGVEFHVPVRVPPQSRVQQTAMAYFPTEVPQTEEERRKNLTAPVTVAELRDASGARRAQEPVLARLLDEGDFGTRLPYLTLVVSSDRGYASEAFDAAGFLEMVREARRYNTMAWSQDPLAFPRHPAALDATGVLVLSECDPEQFDDAQRQTLLEYVRRGGVLVVSAPPVQVTRTSWLADYLPVRLIGSRWSDRIQDEDGVELPLIEWVPLTEALAEESDEVIVLRDEHFVHAAYRDLGLGRIVFTSFPVSGLREDDSAAASLWSRLLNPGYVPDNWDSTLLVAETDSGETRRDMILSRMIGRQVPPWALAAGIAGLYVVSVLGVQVVLGGVGRPRAFATTVVIAGLLTVGLLGAAMLRQQEQQPMSARIAVVDIAEDGGGITREAVAFVGAESNSFGLKVTGPEVSLRPMASFTANDQPVIQQPPFSAPLAGIRLESYQRVWEAQGSVTPGRRISATGRFDAQGLVLSINNELQTPLEAPRLILGTAEMSLGTRLAAGESQARAQHRDAGTMLVSGEDTLRADLLAALRPRDVWLGDTTNQNVVPVLAGFVAGADLPALIEPAAPIDMEARSQALVRTPIRIEPTPVGQSVHIPAPMMRRVLDRSTSMPFDAKRNEWLPSAGGGDWLVGFQPPEGIGALRPVRIQLDANIAAPMHRVTLRRQQVRDGRYHLNRTGEVVADWVQPVGPRETTIELDAGDADADGVIWLMIQVERATPQLPGELPSMWQVQWLRATYDAQVTG